MSDKVLIAEDDLTSREILRRTLRKAGYDVVAVEDGDAAWRALDAPDGPSLAILDWVMPGLDGPEVCRRVRARFAADRGYAYLLLLTGKDKTADIVEGLAAGADDYVTKPFSPAELEARLRVGRRILELEAKLRAERAAYEHQARHDALTGLWARRVVIDHLERELSRGRRREGCVAVILADIDHFKRINDTCGHLIGDEVLIKVAQRLKGSLRVYDGLGRYGGEEFLVVAECRNEEDAGLVAERLRASMAESPIETASGPLTVTASVGVATSIVHGWNGRDLLSAADTALYDAKHAGRNRVVVSTGPAPA
jgi:diguanylate cyclase (GGDEF)-like protein